ncbi:hypothetical protein [Rhizobium tubonense]|uniref:Uncharacterized protein n=1 Tax=Rhizobium tubonense TaxID=484088 RepID=A0A2W4C9V2_9HYPH|nr:hypothetical protein [Rhizobium tubonense]PZM10169.1 hypothetical protein CPY51_23710 [Rhizobium tubonense]
MGGGEVPVALNRCLLPRAEHSKRDGAYMSKILISADVVARSLLDAGDAIECWMRWKRSKGDLVYRYPRADILVVADQGGNVYLMSKSEAGKPKIPFVPFDRDKVCNLTLALGGADD